MVEYTAINNVMDYMKLFQGRLVREGCRAASLPEIWGGEETKYLHQNFL